MQQNKYKLVALSLSTALLLGMSGCGSSDDDNNNNNNNSSNTETTSQSGVAIDGILVGSTVCIDVNKNNTCDLSEPSAITDANGKFTIKATASQSGPLLLSGGIDLSTNAPFKGVLTAPEGSEVVTPLTAAIEAMVKKGKSIEAAKAAIKGAMGLDDVDEDLTKFDPYNGINGTSAAAAKKILAKQTQLQVLVHTAAATIAGADANTNVDDTMGNVFDAIVENMQDGTEVTLDAKTVAIATRQAAAKTFKDASNADALVVAVGTVAEEEAEDAVSAANGAAEAISTSADPIGALDGAINAVNQEDGASASAAVNAQSSLSQGDLAAIKAAREAEDAAIQNAAEAEAKAKRARAEAQSALDAAKTQEELAAAHQKSEAAAAAEKAAAEKAAKSAQEMQKTAEAEKQIDATKAQEKLDTAKAEQEVAAAAAVAAEVAQKAAAEAAKAVTAADADTDLQALQAAAQAAVQAAEQAAAEDLITSYIIVATRTKTTTEERVDKLTQMSSSYEITTFLESATAANEVLVKEYESLLSYRDATATSDLNTTYAKELKDSIVTESLKVTDALSAASAEKARVDLMAAIAAGIADRINTMQGEVIAIYAALKEIGNADKTVISRYYEIVDAALNNYKENEDMKEISLSMDELNEKGSEIKYELSKFLNSIKDTQEDLEDAKAAQNEVAVTEALELVKTYQKEYMELHVTYLDKIEELKKLAAQTEQIVAKIEGVNGQSQNVVDALASLDTLDPTQDSLTQKLTDMKNTLGTENKDELVLAALIDIVEIVNSDIVKNLVETDSELPNLDILSGDVSVVAKMAESATTAGGTEVLHTLAQKLVDASSVIEDAFKDNAKVMNYAEEKITIDEAYMAAAGALSAAAALDLAASYSYGDISYFKTQSKEIDGETYEYTQFDMSPLSLFRESDFFKMAYTSRIVDAGANLKKAAILYTSLTPEFKEQKSVDTTEAEAVLAAFNGDGLLKQEDGSTININKLFSATDYIDREDFNIPTGYSAYSADVIAEYEKQAENYAAVKSYVEDGCSGDAPEEQAIDWDLLENAERNVSVSLSEIDEDLSIQNHMATYIEAKPVYYNWYVNEDKTVCEFYANGESYYGELEFDIEPKESLREVVIPAE